MKIIKRFLSVFLAVALLSSLMVFQFNTVSADSKSTIVGYGPIYGDLLFPFAGTSYKDSIYIQDDYGISVFDTDTSKFKKSFPVKTSVGILKSMNFKSMLSMFSKTDSSSDITNSHYIMPSLGITSNEECIIVEDNYTFGVYNVDSGKKVRSIDVPEFTDSFDKCSSLRHFQVINDTIYMLGLIIKHQEEETEKPLEYLLELTSMDLNGEKVEHFMLNELIEGFEEEAAIVSPMLLSSFSICPDESKLAFLFGFELIVSSKSGDLLSKKDFSDGEYALSNISFYDDATIYLSGISLESTRASEGCNITSYTINEEDSSIKELAKIEVNGSGSKPMHLNCSNKVTIMLTTGKNEDSLQYKTFCISEGKSTIVGGYPNADGQICGSAAFAIDSNNKLYQTNLGASTINVFASDGKFEKSIPIDLMTVSSIMEMFKVYPLILDIEVDEDYLYLSNAFLMMSFSISRYSFETEEWEIIHKKPFGSTTKYPAISIEVFDGNLYCLNLGLNDNLYPIVHLIDDFGELSECDFTFESSDYSPEEQPLWLDIKYDTEEELIYLLDSANSNVLVFDSDEDLQWIINLVDSSEENITLPFYSSIEVCEDVLYVTDLDNNKLCIFDENGNLINTFGKTGSPKLSTTKEAYKENSDAFYGAWKVKLAKNHTSKDDPVYVSDFGNCRFHKIHLTH